MRKTRLENLSNSALFNFDFHRTRRAFFASLKVTEEFGLCVESNAERNNSLEN